MYRPNRDRVVHEPCGLRKITACYARGACARVQAQAEAVERVRQIVRPLSAMSGHPLVGRAMSRGCMP